MEDGVYFVWAGDERRERSGEEVEGGNDDEESARGEGWEGGEVEQGGRDEREGDLFVGFAEL